MNEKDITSHGEVEIPRQLLPALQAAAMLEVEMACDGEWGEDVHLERVEAAVHMRDALTAGSCTREQVIVLASRAAAMQGDATQSDAEGVAESVPVTIGAGWPVTIEQADVLFERVRLTRSLIELRDKAEGKPSPESEVDFA